MLKNRIEGSLFTRGSHTAPARSASGGPLPKTCIRALMVQPAERGADARRRPRRARRRIGRYVEDAPTEPTPQMPRDRLAGAGGFEPPDARSKVSCLTAWPRPTNRTGFPSRSVRTSPPGAGRCRAIGVMATGPKDSDCRKARGDYRARNVASNRDFGAGPGRPGGPRTGGRTRAARARPRAGLRPARGSGARARTPSSRSR